MAYNGIGSCYKKIVRKLKKMLTKDGYFMYI